MAADGSAPFVDRVLGGRNAIGRRIRYRRVGNDGQAPPDPRVQPWLQVVGVVRDLAMVNSPDRSGAGVYLPLDLTSVGSVMIAARVSGDMTAAPTHCGRSPGGPTGRFG